MGGSFCKPNPQRERLQELREHEYDSAKNLAEANSLRRRFRQCVFPPPPEWLYTLSSDSKWRRAAAQGLRLSAWNSTRMRPAEAAALYNVHKAHPCDTAKSYKIYIHACTVLGKTPIRPPTAML